MGTIFAWFIAVSLGAPLVGILLALVVVAWVQMFQLAQEINPWRRRRTYISFE